MFDDRNIKAGYDSLRSSFNDFKDNIPAMERYLKKLSKKLQTKDEGEIILVLGNIEEGINVYLERFMRNLGEQVRQFNKRFNNGKLSTHDREIIVKSLKEVLDKLRDLDRTLFDFGLNNDANMRSITLTYKSKIAPVSQLFSNLIALNPVIRCFGANVP